MKYYTALDSRVLMHITTWVIKLLKVSSMYTAVEVATCSKGKARLETQQNLGVCEGMLHALCNTKKDGKICEHKNLDLG